MSFKFSWPDFDEEFYTNAATQLETALNNGPKPQHICDNILVIEMNMGSIPPHLEILEITDLATDRFRGIFRLSYAGDAHVILQTKVQVNPVTIDHSDQHRSPFMASPFNTDILSAHKPLVVPLQLKICALVLDAIFSLSVSAKNGVTLAFKNDPIQSVLIHSTFDDTQSVRDMLQNEIEKQLRGVFVEVVPRVLHEFSMKYATGEDKDVEELLRVPRSRRASSVDFKNSADSGIGPSISRVDLASDDGSESLTFPHPVSASMVDLRHSAPTSPVKASVGYFSTPNVSPRSSIYHHPSLSMHLYPYRGSLSTRSEAGFPSSRKPEFDTLSLPRSSSPRTSNFHINTLDLERSIHRQQRRSNPIVMSPTTAKRQNHRLSTSPPISPIVGLHPANLRAAPPSSKHVLSRPKD